MSRGNRRLDKMPLTALRHEMDVNAEEAEQAVSLILRSGGDPSSFALTADAPDGKWTLRMSRETCAKVRKALGR